MIRWIRKSPSPEARAFDQFLDGIAGNHSRVQQSGSSDLERFATWVQGPPPIETALSPESEQVLRQLLSAQQSYLDSVTQTGLLASSEAGSSADSRHRFPTDDFPSRHGPKPVQSGRLPGARGDVEAEESPIRLKWARVPTYLAAIVLIALISSASLVFLFSTQDGNNKKAASIPGATDTVSTQSATDVAATVDPRPIVVIDGVEVAVTSWELNAVIDTAFADEFPARGEFLVLQVALTNTRGIANQDAPFKDLIVVDGENEAYAIDKFATVLANDAIDGTESLSNIRLETGVEHVVYLVFDVPIESTSFQLTNLGKTFLVPIVGP